MDVHIQQETPQIWSPSVLKVPVSVIPKTTTLPPIPEIPTETPVSTALSLPHVTPTISIVQQTTTPIPTPPITTEAPTITTDDVSKLKKIEHSAEALASRKSQVPTVVKYYLGSKIGDDLQKVLQRHTTELIQMYYVKPSPEPSKIQKPIINLVPESEKTLKEYDLKNALYQTINENKSFNKNPAHHVLYHALMEALIDENVMDKGVADTLKNHKRQHDDDKDDDEDPSARPNYRKAPSKSSKTGKSATTKELIKEPTTKVVMDDLETNANKDVVNDSDRPRDDVAPKTNKPSRDTWFKQPPRPPTPDLE
ncbi:hypothetical protein Tco_0793169 [Tanacetum coccineum]